ncbi:hypothetical protein [Bacillus haynesii]|uniref:hypothetical protein n=1 Tax=Bacillus haynesii TaxID=1925021 RepID=UPI00227F6FB4|nr:hypothetical protein [Bacillus haynesii]MCY7850284.1 hypothetical protein [Bacillus haynesii]MCY8077061.1 hypothetical protein [Bacillus haynesii]MCY8539954.1 hypothetical protein [Bacillus haynesii]MEC0632287.1 hypothetical protein [Bacillus haynesii]
MKKEDIEKLLEDKLNPITKRLDEIEKERSLQRATEGMKNKNSPLLNKWMSCLNKSSHLFKTGWKLLKRAAVFQNKPGMTKS